VAWGVPQAGAGGALGDDVAREGGTGIEPRILTPGALRTEAATVAAIREAPTPVRVKKAIEEAHHLNFREHFFRNCLINSWTSLDRVFL
jgi:hypothetical protein